MKSSDATVNNFAWQLGEKIIEFHNIIFNVLNKLSHID